MSDPDVLLIRRIRRLARLVGAAVGMVAGVLYGSHIVAHSGGAVDGRRSLALAAVLAAGAAAAAALALALPVLSVDPFVGVRRVLREAPPVEIVGAVAGLLVALVITALVAVLLDRMPWGSGDLATVALGCALVHVGISTGRQRAESFVALLRGGRTPDHPPAPETPGASHPPATTTVVDTSALIDGRLAGVVAAGFLGGTLVVPECVLTELREVADSSTPTRRARGRRGLAILDALRADGHVVVDVSVSTGAVDDVDARLLTLARDRGAALLTTDYNLDQLARVAEVRVLNLNRLAAALKPSVGAGDSLRVTVLREGTEHGQGIGYLDDGTTVVVEGGAEHRGSTVSATVDRVIQSASGRMIFATAGDGSRASVRRPRAAEAIRR